MPGANDVTTVLGVSPLANFRLADTFVPAPAWVLVGVTVSVSPAASADAGSAPALQPQLRALLGLA